MYVYHPFFFVRTRRVTDPLASSAMSKARAVASAQRRVKKSAVVAKEAVVKDARLAPVSVVVTLCVWVWVGWGEIWWVDGCFFFLKYI